MKRMTARATMTVAFLVVSNLGWSTPFYFDFTGTIAGTDTAISGGFNLESDRLLAAPGPPVNGRQYDFVDWEPANLTEPLAFLNFGDQSITFPRYGSTYGLVTFVEGCAESPCAQLGGDSFNLFSETRDAWLPGYTGTVYSSSIFVLAISESLLPDYPYYSGLDTFDGATAVPLDVVDLPLYFLVGFYSENAYECVAGECAYASGSQISFSLDTVTRGIGPREVPEPGTLALFGAAFGGLLLVRRRRSV